MAGEITQDMLLKMLSDVSSLVQGMDTVVGHLDKFGKGLQEVEKNTGILNNALSVFAGTMATKVVGAATQAFGILKTGVDQFVGMAKGATLQSARLEVQWRVLSGTAARMGVTFGDAQEAVGNLRAAGIKTGEALQVMTQWLSAGLPSEKLSELSRAAQDLAVVLGADSTQAMERFNWFVQTGNSELLRTVGIMQTSTQMEEKFAAGIGKTRDQLTDQERRLARVNGLLEATVAYAGSYEEALRDPFKRLTSLPRLISNVTEAIGAVFVPLLGAGVDIISDLLEKVESLFRVTKSEAKATGATLGEWKEGFLKLRATVQAFANWFMSIWERLTTGFDEQAKGLLERFADFIVKVMQKLAEALKKFAAFMAGIFGGRAPGEVTAEAIARTKPTPKKAPPKREVPVAGPPVEEYVTPKEREKLLEKPVEAVSPEWLVRTRQEETAGAMRALQAAGFGMADAQKIVGQFFEKSLPDVAKWLEYSEKLNQATAMAEKASQALAKAEERVKQASEKVYDIRRKIQRLEMDWAEIPERFVRGRKRQLQLELQAAEHEEHQRQEEREAAQEKLKAAEKYRDEMQKMTDELGQQLRQIGNEIIKQNEAYEEWKKKLEEASEVRIVEPVQQVANEFESLDDLTAQYLEEIEGELMPAFASIEESMLAIVDNFGRAWEKAKGLGADLKDKVLFVIEAIGPALVPVKNFFVWLWDVILKIADKLGEIFKIGEALKPVISEMVPQVSQALKIETVTKAGQGDVGAIAKILEEAADVGLLPGAAKILKPVLELFAGSKKEVKDAVGQGVVDPMVSEFDRASQEIVEGSIIPDMINSILDWFGRLADDVVTPLEQFTNAAIAHFDKLTQEWQVDIKELIVSLEKLTDRFELLGDAMKGLAPAPEALKMAAEGTFKVITIDLRGASFGAGVSESEVKSWMYEALVGVV